MKKRPIYDERMDRQCIELCDALNACPGIRTMESCCGHGRGSFMVFLTARKPRDLFFLGRALSRNYYGLGQFGRGWSCDLNISDRPQRPVSFFLSSNDRHGRAAYDDAKKIAKAIMETLRHPAVLSGFKFKGAEQWARRPRIGCRG